jgi:hypothetical protein
MASRMAPSIRRSRSEGVISPRSACARKMAQMCWSAASTVSTVITVPISIPGIPPGMPGRVRGFGPHCGPTLLPHEGSATARAPAWGTSTRPLCFWSGVPLLFSRVRLEHADPAFTLSGPRPPTPPGLAARAPGGRAATDPLPRPAARRKRPVAGANLRELMDRMGHGLGTRGPALPARQRPNPQRAAEPNTGRTRVRCSVHQERPPYDWFRPTIKIDRAIHLTGGVLVIRSPGPSSWGPVHARRPAAGRRRRRRRP